MTKQELLIWLEANPGNQERIEELSGLSKGYVWKLKTKDIKPSLLTMKAIEMAINIRRRNLF